MSDFTLDTSGKVFLPRQPSPALWAGFHYWPDLSPFTKGYVEAMFRACGDEHGVFIQDENRDAGFSDLSPEALALILRDCKAAQGASPALRLDGRHFWEGRQRGEWELFPPLDPYLADTGKVCLRVAA